MIDTLIFDLGKTLYPHSVIHNTWRKVLPEYKIDPERFLIHYYSYQEKYEGSFSSISKIIDVLKSLDIIIINPEGLLKVFREELRQAIQSEITMDHHKTWEFLRSIKGDFKLGVLSDNSLLVKKEWLQILDSLNANVFDEFIVSEEIGVEKPDKLMFTSILEKIKSKPENSLYFGDNLFRDSASENVGMKFIYVTGYTKPERSIYQSIKYINKISVSNLI